MDVRKLRISILGLVPVVICAVSALGDILPHATLSHPEDEELTEAAICALGKIGDPRATAMIVSHLSSESDRIRMETIDALCLLNDQRAFGPLIKALGEPSRKGDHRFRSRALEALYHSVRQRRKEI